MESDVLSDSIRSNSEGSAQQAAPQGAGTARAAGGNGGAAQAEPEIRWVGDQRLMEGYCGRAVVTGRAEVAAVEPTVTGVGRGPAHGPGARVYSVRPVALLHRPRNAVVRIGPRARADDEAAAATGASGMVPEQTQARAA